MRNNFVLGIGLLIIGFGIVLVLAPYFTALGSSVWLDETFVVPEGYYYYYYTQAPFPSKTTLHIPFAFRPGGFPAFAGLFLILLFFLFVAAYGIFKIVTGVSRALAAPKGHLKKCVGCGIEIPIASEECPYCQTRQPEYARAHNQRTT